MEITAIKKHMKEQKITYAQLSEMTGLSLSTITKIFGGYATNPRVDTMQAIERALGIGGGWTAEERAAGVVERMSVPITADEDEIITLLREVEERKGAAAREIAQNVVETVLEGMLK